MDKKQEAIAIGTQQIKDIRKAALDMKDALVTDDDEQIKFILTTVRLVHAYLFNEAPRLAAKKVLASKY